MTDPLSAVASVVTITDRAIAAWHRVFRKDRKVNQQNAVLITGRPKHKGLEILAIQYRASLNGNQPHISVALYAVNYTKHPLTLRILEVRRLQLPNGVALDPIHLSGEHEIAPMTCKQVFCNRNLTDADARLIRAGATAPTASGSAELLARGMQDEHEISYGPVSNMTLDGIIDGVFNSTKPVSD